MSEYGEVVLLEKFPDEGWARITLNRPDKRNAMNNQAMSEFRSAMAACRGDTKAIIITGNGPAFCAGIDLKERREILAGTGPQREYAFGGNAWAETVATIRPHSAVCIAAVNGISLGGGATLINACDLAIAADEASIGMPEMGFATYPGLAGPSTQMRLLPKHAAWLVLTTNRIDGKTAAQWGLVNRSVPLTELQSEAEALARQIAQFDPIALDFSKHALGVVPSQISDWNEAIQYGAMTNYAIRSQTRTVAEALDRFASGQRNPGQGR